MSINGFTKLLEFVTTRKLRALSNSQFTIHYSTNQYFPSCYSSQQSLFGGRGASKYRIPVLSVLMNYLRHQLQGLATTTRARKLTITITNILLLDCLHYNILTRTVLKELLRCNRIFQRKHFCLRNRYLVRPGLHSLIS